MVGTNVKPANVIAHDDQDVRLLLLSDRRSSHYNRCQADSEERRCKAIVGRMTSNLTFERNLDCTHGYLLVIDGTPPMKFQSLRRTVAIKRLRQRQKVRGRRMQIQKKPRRRHLPGLLPHEYEAWASS